MTGWIELRWMRIAELLIPSCQGPLDLEMEAPDFSVHNQSWVKEVPGCCWRPEQGDEIREKGGDCLETTFLLASHHSLTSTYI